MDIFSNTPLTLHFTEFNYIQPDSIKISPFHAKVEEEKKDWFDITTMMMMMMQSAMRSALSR